MKRRTFLGITLTSGVGAVAGVDRWVTADEMRKQYPKESVKPVHEGFDGVTATIIDKNSQLVTPTFKCSSSEIGKRKLYKEYGLDYNKIKHRLAYISTSFTMFGKTIVASPVYFGDNVQTIYSMIPGDQLTLHQKIDMDGQVIFTIEITIHQGVGYEFLVKNI